jgi:hypothetical protein
MGDWDIQLQQRLQQKARKLLLDVRKFLIKFISVAEAAVMLVGLFMT